MVDGRALKQMLGALIGVCVAVFVPLLTGCAAGTSPQPTRPASEHPLPPGGPVEPLPTTHTPEHPLPPGGFVEPLPTTHTAEHPLPVAETLEPRQPVRPVARVARDACSAELEVLRRCVDPNLSPGEPYLLHHNEGLRIIFRSVAVDEFGSLVRRLGPEERWVVEDAPDGVRRGILERGTFTVACDKLPPDGVYYLDLCPVSVPPEACGTRATATASTVIEIERAGKRPLRQRPGVAPMQVSLSPDRTHPKCTFDPYSGPIHYNSTAEHPQR